MSKFIRIKNTIVNVDQINFINFSFAGTGIHEEEIYEMKIATINSGCFYPARGSAKEMEDILHDIQKVIGKSNA